MKKVLLLSCLSLMVFASCKKKDNKTPEEIYAERINGDWNVSRLDYTAVVNVPILGPFPINGTANEAGTVSFNTPAGTALYDIRFLPTLGNLPGAPAVDTIRLNGSGTFTNTTSSITLTESGGDVIVFTVEVNDENLQILKTNLNYQLDSVTTVPVGLELRMNRK
ncbi:MAG: hypothetical protein ACK417_05810 [Bacteroidia bacterium]